MASVLIVLTLSCSTPVAERGVAAASMPTDPTPRARCDIAAVDAASASADAGKRAAGEAAAGLVDDGMAVGLGTGSTVAFFLPAGAHRDLDVRCVATSPGTAEAAAGLGLAVEDFDTIGRLDIAIDGADQVSPDGWLVKGGGG